MIDYRLQTQFERILTKSTRREHYPILLEQNSYIQFWCLQINCITILRRLIYANWLTKRKVMWILGWELIITILLCRQLVRMHFPERSFIYTAPCEWNKLSECIITTRVKHRLTIEFQHAQFIGEIEQFKFNWCIYPLKCYIVGNNLTYEW